jgi:hypothetical protein
MPAEGTLNIALPKKKSQLNNGGGGGAGGIQTLYLRNALAELAAVLQVQGRHSVGNKEEHLEIYTAIFRTNFITVMFSL